MKTNTILVVEDELDLNAFLCEYMDLYFNKVYSATNGQQALELYNTHKPDVIFTDVNLPKLNGLDLAEIIRKEDKRTIIVVLSAFTDKEKLFKAIQLHLLSYLVKPIESHELEQAVLNIKKQLASKEIVRLDTTSQFNLTTNQLFINNEEIKLTLHEKKFINLLLQNRGTCVSYNEISIHLEDINTFTKDAISSLVKRLRKKLQSNLVVNCFNEGYKIELEN